jgi:uncharacterized protein (DUF362 family)
MIRSTVAAVRYERPTESVRRAVELCRGLHHLPARARVFIKPNNVFWTPAVPFPKWGVITTTRVVEDLVSLLKQHGVEDITIGEGTVTMKPRDTATAAHAFETLGYSALKRRYGIKCLNVFERPFTPVELARGYKLSFSVDALESDFILIILLFPSVFA